MKSMLQTPYNESPSKRIYIDSIYPDVRQPRRSVPSKVRQVWDPTSDTVEDLLRIWQEMAAAEAERPFDLVTLLERLSLDAEDNVENDFICGCVSEKLFKLTTIAASIYHDGLINPITVQHDGNEHLLETGERRWLAHHLLRMMFGDDSWNMIEAHIVDRVDIWRQAGENNARQNLSAVAKSRQLALLLMDLHKNTDPETEFQPIGEFDHERQFYAQITVEPYHRVPRGKSQRLLAATALKHSRQISHYRALLTLPDLAWDIADDHNLTERTLRRVAQSNDLTDREIINRVRDMARRSLQDETDRHNSGRKPGSTETVEPGTKRYFNRLMRTLRQASPNKRETSEHGLKQLEELESWLQQERSKLETYIRINERNIRREQRKQNRSK